MEDKTVPYLVYEGTQARNERTIRRLIIVIVVTILLLFASNALWLYEWCQYDYETEIITYTQDGRGLNTINLGHQEGIEYGAGADSTAQTP